MCAIVGALVWGLTTPEVRDEANRLLNFIMAASHERGRDGRGFVVHGSPNSRYKDVERADSADWMPEQFFNGLSDTSVMIGNLRAEPTTEYVESKRLQDQQPYSCQGWSIVHNGTIANDAALRTGEVDTLIDSAAIAELLGKHKPESPSDAATHFLDCVSLLKGSYAILAAHESQPGHMLVAANYRPVWYVQTEIGIFFASARHYFPKYLNPIMLEPYSAASFYNNQDGEVEVRKTRVAHKKPGKALVVCSGGLDSVVSATWAVKQGYKVTLLHFRYGSRAEGREVSALWKVAKELGVGMWIRGMDIYEPTDSPLLQADSPIAGGEEGAEFAHEWVPARNLVMLAHATAIAEAKGFETIILGNNLEEAGAYPDNEPEFIARFNDLLPFATGDGKHVRIEMPVGNLMKHEIVALGKQIGAPMHLTWSCYRSGELHCGKCGPCYMRRKAFEINGLDEVIQYQQ